jgi:hypothetical protein
MVAGMPSFSPAFGPAEEPVLLAKVVSKYLF